MPSRMDAPIIRGVSLLSMKAWAILPAIPSFPATRNLPLTLVYDGAVCNLVGLVCHNPFAWFQTTEDFNVRAEVFPNGYQPEPGNAAITDNIQRRSN